VLQYKRSFFIVTIIITIFCTVSFSYADGQPQNAQEILGNSVTANIIFLAAALISAAAIFVSVWTYKKTSSIQSYEDIDETYREILHMAMENPKLRDPKFTKNYKISLKGNDLIQYESYAYIVWNFCETISDRTEDDKLEKKTWYPSIAAERELHQVWFENNREKFKKKFLNFMEEFDTKLKEVHNEPG
jgi:hypothetical protein